MKYTNDSDKYCSNVSEFLTLMLDDQVLAINVEKIRDVLTVHEIAFVPLVPKEVIGLINLRGKIVTALDLRSILRLDTQVDLKKCMNVVIEYNNELYSLVVDGVGEVLKLTSSEIVENPGNMSDNWKEVSIGIYPQNDNLVIIADINKMLSLVYTSKVL